MYVYVLYILYHQSCTKFGYTGLKGEEGAPGPVGHPGSYIIAA